MEESQVLNNDTFFADMKQKNSILFFAVYRVTKDGFFFVSPVSAGIDSYCRKFASFAPPFDSQRRDSKNFCNFTDGKEIWECINRQFLVCHRVCLTVIININLQLNYIYSNKLLQCCQYPIYEHSMVF